MNTESKEYHRAYNAKHPPTSVRISRELRAEIQALVDDGHFPSLSKAMKAVIKAGIQELRSSA